MLSATMRGDRRHLEVAALDVESHGQTLHPAMAFRRRDIGCTLLCIAVVMGIFVCGCSVQAYADCHSIIVHEAWQNDELKALRCCSSQDVVHFRPILFFCQATHHV